jgi:hypothetical protein
MFDRRESDEDLAADIGFGLKKAKIKLPIEVRRLIGARVVAQLAGWQFRRKEPDPPHSAGGR